MNKTKIITRKGVSNLIIKSQKGQILSDREAYALSTGGVAGLLRLQVEDKGGKFTLFYNVTGYVTLRQFLRASINRDIFVRILSDIVETFRAMKSAYFNEQLVLLDPDRVMVDPASMHVYFVYVPIQNLDSGSDLREFLLSLIQIASFSPDESNDYVGDYIGILNSGINFSMFELEEFVRRLQGFAPPAQTEQRTCPKCGTPAPEHTHYCRRCGFKLSGATGDTGSNNTYDPLSGQQQSYNQPPVYEQQQSYNQQPVYEQQQSYNQSPVYEQEQSYNQPPAYEQQQSYNQPPVYEQEQSYNQQPVYEQQQSYNQQPVYEQQQSYNQPPAYEQEQSYNQPPVYEQQQGYNQQPVYEQQQSYNQPPVYEQQQSYNQPPVYEQQSYNQPPAYEQEQGYNQPPVYEQQQSYNQPPVYEQEQSYNQPPVYEQQQSYNQPPVYEQQQSYNQPPSPERRSGTTVLGVESLNRAMQCYLLRRKTGEKILLDKSPFRVGFSDASDYVVSDNTAVSRRHADFTRRGYRCYVTDLKSTNGTLVDGKLIPTETETELFSGTAVTLADEEFVFIME